jgi:hypothetical protein
MVIDESLSASWSTIGRHSQLGRLKIFGCMSKVCLSIMIRWAVDFPGKRMFSSQTVFDSKAEKAAGQASSGM